MNVYDFDKTIFYPDSSVTFFFHCLKAHPLAVIRTVPWIIGGALKKAFGGSTKELKESLFSFLRHLPDAEGEVERFWEANFHRIGEWYLAQKHEDDLIISASPEFLVRPAAKRLGVRLIATDMDIGTGAIRGENCHDIEKVRRFNIAFDDAEIDEFYSDSLSDTPMADLANKAFLVKKHHVSPWVDPHREYKGE